MANNGTKNSNDSQFFITLGSYSNFMWRVVSSDWSQIEQMNYMGNIRFSDAALAIRSSVGDRFIYLQPGLALTLIMTVDAMKIGSMGEQTTNLEARSSKILT